MNRPGHDHAEFFVGDEIEHSPVRGHRTLFVVGLQNPDNIAWQVGEHDRAARTPITHIYFGANHSFPRLSLTDPVWNQWISMVQTMLARGYWCTLDLDVACVDGLNESGLTESPRFVPMISVKLPYIGLLGYNAVIKLDDHDFAATNPGVWCHDVHTLMDRGRFTPWDQYRNDQVIK
jgi:hypothetical protein